MPNRSWSTLAIGARQFVVHEALEMTVCCVGVEDLVVHAHADHGVGVTRRRRDDDPLGAAGEVAGGLVAGGEDPGRLDHHVDAVLAPGDLGRVTRLELADLVAVDREAGVGGLDLVGQHAPDGVVLEQERHRLAVAEGVVHRHQLDAGAGAPGEDRPVEGAADAPEAVDAHTYRHVLFLPSGPTSSAQPPGADPPRGAGRPQRAYEAEPSSALARAAGSWTWPSGPATSAATGSTPRRGRDLVGGQLAPEVIEERVDPGAVVEDGPQVVGGVEAQGLGDLGLQVADVDDPGPGGGQRLPDGRHAQHRRQAGEQRPGGEDDLVGHLDGADRVRVGLGVGGDDVDPPDPVHRVRHRHLAFDGAAPRVVGRPRFGGEHHRVGGGRQHPPGALQEPAGLVERPAEVAEHLGEADDDQVAEGVAVEVAAQESGARTPPARPCRRRPGRPGTCADRRARARRGRGGAGPRSRRRRPR